jgi:exodeoxyribonuclease VII small subunit
VTDEIGYAEAMAELGEILEELEGDDLDVDVLAERVRRAGELITSCRARIARARADVEGIVTDLESFAPSPGNGEERARQLSEPGDGAPVRRADRPGSGS